MSKKKNKKKNYHYNSNINKTKKHYAASAKDSLTGNETVNTEIESEASAKKTETLAIEVLEMSEASEIGVAEANSAEITEEETALPEVALPEIEAAEVELPAIEAAEAFEEEIKEPETELPAIETSEAFEEETRETQIKAAEIELPETEILAAPEDVKAIAENAAEAKESNVSNGHIDIDGGYRKSHSSKTLSDHARFWTVSGLKVIVPVALCIVVIAAIVSFALSKKADYAGDDEARYIDEPLQENAYENVNEFIDQYFKALSEGDANAIASLMDYIDNTTLITYEKRSDFIEAYTNIICYTKPGLEENSYFVYAAYDAKVNGIDTVAPGLVPLYVYTAQDGSLKIDGDRDERVEAAFKLVTNQDDVVDLYNRIDVKYKEVVAADENLKVFMDELPGKVKTSVGEALAQIERQNAESESETETETATDSQQTDDGQTQNQPANKRVKATATVNVRKSDSENADRIGKVLPGTELTRVEEKVNGWSKVIYEGKEAYIKSDYLEVITAETAAAPDASAGTDDTNNAANTAAGSVKAKTNVNVRGAASQDSEKLGVAQAGRSYELLENLGEWYKIKYNGKTGYVKAEYFQ